MLAVFHGTRDRNVFGERIQAVINEVPADGVFAGDNLFTFNRNLGFLRDERLMAAFNAHTETVIEKSLLWRYHVVCWNAQRALRLDGDFIECACYRGISARIVADYVDLEASGKAYYLYDLFEHADDMPHHGMTFHGKDLYDEVCARFADFSNVHVVKGPVQETLRREAPEMVAFMHLDINNADAEISALEILCDRIVRAVPSCWTITAGRSTGTRRPARTPGSARAATGCSSCPPARGPSSNRNFLVKPPLRIAAHSRGNR